MAIRVFYLYICSLCITEIITVLNKQFTATKRQVPNNAEHVLGG